MTEKISGIWGRISGRLLPFLERVLPPNSPRRHGTTGGKSFPKNSGRPVQARIRAFPEGGRILAAVPDERCPVFEGPPDPSGGRLSL